MGIRHYLPTLILYKPFQKLNTWAWRITNSGGNGCLKKSVINPSPLYYSEAIYTLYICISNKAVFPDNSLLILTTCKCDMLECTWFGGFRVYSRFYLAKNRKNSLYFPRYQGIYMGDELAADCNHRHLVH